MPYASVRELPAEVKKAHPFAVCQHTFLVVFNARIKAGDAEASAFRIAHNAAGYCDRKQRGQPTTRGG